MSFVKITTSVPIENADIIREVLGKAGAGKQGEYSFCSFSYRGQGRFLPSKNAKPAFGKPEELTIVEEERIEVICDRDLAHGVIEKLRAAHPYEEPMIDICQLISEEEL